MIITYLLTYIIHIHCHYSHFIVNITYAILNMIRTKCTLLSAKQDFFSYIIIDMDKKMKLWRILFSKIETINLWFPIVCSLPIVMQIGRYNSIVGGLSCIGVSE